MGSIDSTLRWEISSSAKSSGWVADYRRKTLAFRHSNINDRLLVLLLVFPSCLLLKVPGRTVVEVNRPGRQEMEGGKPPPH